MSLLSPSSIAVIGASTEEKKVGHEIFKNLLTQGFKGELYPVNPKHPEILGKKAYVSVKEIPGTVDLAIIVTPAATVAGLLEECAAKGIGNVIVITAGFKETGDEGHKREEEVQRIARDHKITLVGTNCLGLLRPSIGMNASFAKDLPPAGGIALITQSGALGVALIDEAVEQRLGFSFVVSVGNKTAMDECDYLELAAADPETNVIALYLESVERGARFRELSAHIAKEKPIVLLKSGVSTAGSKAASSHTGALAGSDAAVKALCAQTGIHRAQDAEHFLDLIAVLSTQPVLLSPNIAIITNAGGPGILATDKAEAEHLQLPGLTPERDAALKKTLPPAASTKNPIDVLGDGDAARYQAALAACAEDSHIDGVCVLLTPQVMTPCAEIAKSIVATAKKAPLMPVVTSFMGGPGVAEARMILKQNDIPTFDTPERAIRALAALRRREPREATLKTCPVPSHAAGTGARLLKGHSGLLGEDATQQLLTAYALPTPKQALAHSAEEAVTMAEQIGFPLVMKISSPQIIHKTDVGGIRANVKTVDEVRDGFTAIMESVKKKAPTADVRGVLLQQFLPVGNEFIVGALRDPSFGPLVMVGLGGIYTELFADTSFRLAPISEEDAYAMLQELKAWKVLLGMRGRKQSDIAALACLLTKVGTMIAECPQIKELDLNPVFVSDEGVIAVDAKVIVG